MSAPPLTGFGSHHESEAVAGALPVGRNSPQKPPFGLYAEQLSGTAFTAPRASNLRSWLYRLHPSAMHGAFSAASLPRWRTAPCLEVSIGPNRLRWLPLPLPDTATDFLEGVATLATSGDARLHAGAAAHLYAANRGMNRCFANHDGELVFVPQEGALALLTEFGRLDVAPGEIAIVPRGVRFRVDVTGPVRGYLCENYGMPFRLPELGPIGANGLANPRDFVAPQAAYEAAERETELWVKAGGVFWSARLAHSPLDVVAWHGNLYPVHYDLARFNALNTVSFDHPDPSIFTVLTSPSDTPGTANADFVVFPPRWTVADDTFRPPWFHRNVMSELMGLIRGQYDGKKAGFIPGGASLHNALAAHGPDRATHEAATAATLAPQYLAGTLAFMLETRLPFSVTAWAHESPHRDQGYDAAWSGFPAARLP